MLKDLLLSKKRQGLLEREQPHRKAITPERTIEQEIAIMIWKRIKIQLLRVRMEDFADLKNIYVMAKYAVTTDDVLVLVLLTCGTVENKEQDDEKEEYVIKELHKPLELFLLGLDVRQLSKVMDRVKQCADREEIDEIWEERDRYCAFCYNLELDN